MPYAVCDIIGSGTDGDPFRPAIADYMTQGITKYQAVIDQSIRNHCLVYCQGDTTAAFADSRIVGTNAALSHVITQAEADNWNARFAKYNFPEFINAGDTVGQTLRQIGRYIQNQFDVTWINN